MGQADRRIDRIVGVAAPSSQRHHRQADVTRVHTRHMARALGGAGLDHRRAGEIAAGLVEEVVRTAQRRHHAGEFLRRATVREGGLSAGSAGGDARRQLAQRQHLAGQCHHHFVQARLARAFAFQVGDGLGDLERIADVAAQHAIHVGDQRHGRQAGAVGDGHQALRQVAGHLFGVAEGAGAAFDVHHQPVEAGRDLLAQDRAHDQRDRFDAAGDVAHGIEPPVGRRQLVGLADDGAADLAHDLAEGRDVRLRLVARDGRELVECAAGVAEPAAGDHRHERAARRHDWRQHQAHLVADPAARMLVDHRSRQAKIAPVELDARSREA